MEGIFAGILFIVFGVVIFGVYQWLTEKYFGVRYHGKFGYPSALKESENEESMFKLQSEIDPVGISKAIAECKRKKFALTHKNILKEYEKIK